MIVNLLMASNSTVAGDFESSISPPVFFNRTTNGNYTTPIFECSQQNGVGPFEYQWSFTGGSGASVTINSPTSERTNLNISAANNEIELTLSCIIKDTGNADEERESSAQIRVIFGVAP